MEDRFTKRRKKGKITKEIKEREQKKLRKEKRNFNDRSPIIKKMYL